MFVANVSRVGERGKGILDVKLDAISGLKCASGRNENFPKLVLVASNANSTRDGSTSLSPPIPDERLFAVASRANSLGVTELESISIGIIPLPSDFGRNEWLVAGGCGSFTQSKLCRIDARTLAWLTHSKKIEIGTQQMKK